MLETGGNVASAAAVAADANLGNDDNDAEQPVIIEQRLLKINHQLFIYRIPPMQSIDGHRAELWNLSKPLLPNACSIEVHRKNDELIIDILADRPKTGEGAVEGAKENYLFARSIVHLNITSNNALEHWISPTIDSSRYFALRISNPSTKQEVLIGIGFIERNDATNFRMACDDYVNSLMREKKAMELHRQFEESLAIDEAEESEEQQQQHTYLKSNLGLKEGEKLHINISTNANNSRIIKKVKGTTTTGGTIGLKKPPPPPTDAVAAAPLTTTTTAAASSLDDSCVCKNDETEDGGVDWGDFEG
jgi:hypothetical protein